MQASFDHLVGASEHRQGHGKSECLRGLEVDDQLDVRGLLHRQIGRFLAFEYPTGIDADLPVRILNTGSVALQTAGHCELTKSADRGHGIAPRQCSELFALRIEV